MNTRANRWSLPLVAAVILVFTLTACAGSRFGGGSPSPSEDDAVPSADASVEPSEAPSEAPSDDLGPFACDFPIEERGDPVHTQLVDVRVGTHDGYDRVVFEFDNGIPEFILERADAPYTEDPSGLPIEVDGDSVLRLIMIGGTRVTPDYEETYTGPFEFEPGFAKLVNLVEAGDFEAVSSWYIGLSGSSCARVLALDGPDRLVVDIEH